MTSATVVSVEGSLLSEVERTFDALQVKAVTVSHTLRAGSIPHAVIGGLAVAAHVMRADRTAVRVTRDLDLLMNRADMPAARAVLGPLGYEYREVIGFPEFIPAGGKYRDAIHVVCCGELIRKDYVLPAPQLAADSTVPSETGFLCLSMRDLLAMKLTSFRHKDITHIQDMLDVGLITPELEAALPVEILGRLQQVKDETERERLG